MGEAAPYQGYLPASITAKWVGGGTVAMFLEQPEADTIFGPICDDSVHGVHTQRCNGKAFSTRFNYTR